MRVRNRLATCFVLVGAVLAVASTASAGTAPGPSGSSQWWHSPNIYWADVSGGGGVMLGYLPCISAPQYSMLEVDRDSGWLKVNRVGSTRFHTMGEFKLSFRVQGPQPDYTILYRAQPVTVSYNDVISPTEPGYAIDWRNIQIDLMPVGGGDAVRMVWPIGIAAVYGDTWFAASSAMGYPSCVN